jgi:putative ABC transport system substrate-binding protein
MKRRTVGFLVTLALGILAALPVADAQQTAKGARIGFLAGGGRGGLGGLLNLFQQALREFGYVEGQNIAIEPRFAEGRDNRLPALAAELVHLKVDVIVATSTPAALAAQKATRTLPIVMAIGGDPLQTGLITSLARPEGNVTGTFQNPSELTDKLLELLKEVMPGLSRLAVLWVPTNPALGAELKELERGSGAGGAGAIPHRTGP